MTSGATAVTASLGIAVSSLERILVVHRNSSAINDGTKQSLGARITNGLQNFQFSIDSQLYPQNPILVGDSGAEALAEYLISSHQISNFENDAHIQSQLYYTNVNVSGTATPQVINAYEGLYQYFALPATNNTSNCWFNGSGDGSLLPVATAGAAANLVSKAGSFVASLELENGTSAGRSDRLYSGVSTLGSVVQYIGAYSGAVTATIDFFCHYTIMCTLNMRTTGVWVVSV